MVDKCGKCKKCSCGDIAEYKCNDCGECLCDCCSLEHDCYNAVCSNAYDEVFTKL